MSETYSERSRTNNAILLATICALAFLWFGEGFYGSKRLAVTLVFGVVSLGIAASALVFQRTQIETSEREILRGLEFLDSEDSSSEWPAKTRDFINGNGVLGERLESLRRRKVQWRQRSLDWEHIRAATELRCRRLSNERDRFAEALESIPEPILMSDQFDEICFANQGARSLLGLDGFLSSGMTLSESIDSPVLRELLTDCRRKATGKARVTEVTIAGPLGDEHDVRVHTRSLRGTTTADENPSSSGVGQGAIAVLADNQDKKELQKRNAEFVSAVSHEMKAPLSGIRAYAEMLADEDVRDDATREAFLEVILSQADRLHRLVENMLSIARIEAGVIRVTKAAQSLNDILTAALHVVAPTAEAKSITLKSELSSMFVGVYADKDLLLQCAINLLSNAIKYTPQGGEVVLSSELTDEEVIFSVADNGVGIAPQDLEKVFDRFYRVKKDAEMAPGTGLGLSLVKHIVEDVHGGRIEVSSQIGAGSVFQVIVPSLNRGANTPAMA